MARPDDGTSLVGYGFRDGLWPHPPSLAALDAVAPERPVILVSGDLHCAWVNSRAAVLLGVSPDEFGLVREMEWINANHRVAHETVPGVEKYREAAEAAARRGLIGLVDFESADLLTEWPARVAAGVTSLRVEASVWPDRLEAALAAGFRTGDVLEDSGLITFGRLKVVVDGSLNTRTALCHEPTPTWIRLCQTPAGFRASRSKSCARCWKPLMRAGSRRPCTPSETKPTSR